MQNTIKNPMTENNFITDTNKNVSKILSNFYGNENFGDYPVEKIIANIVPNYNENFTTIDSKQPQNPPTINDYIYYQPVVRQREQNNKKIYEPNKNTQQKQQPQIVQNQISKEIGYNNEHKYKKKHKYSDGYGVCVPYNVQIGPLMVPKSICYGTRNNKTCIYDPEGDDIFCPNWTVNNENNCVIGDNGNELFCVKSTKDNICIKENSKLDGNGICINNDKLQNKICLNDANNNNILCGRSYEDKFCIYNKNNSGVCFPYYKGD